MKVLVSELLDYDQRVDSNEDQCESMISKRSLHHLTRYRRQNGVFKDAILASNPIAILPASFHDGERYGRNVKFTDGIEQAQISRSTRRSCAHVSGVIRHAGASVRRPPRRTPYNCFSPAVL